MNNDDSSCHRLLKPEVRKIDCSGLAETVATLTLGLKITIPYNPLLFNKIKYPQPSIKDLFYKAEKYDSELLKAKAVPGIFHTKAGLARKLGISKARLTQIMNLLKLAPEIQEYLKSLNDPSLLSFFNEKRLRPIANIKDNQIQLEKFKELKRNIGI
jgi:hypothetical protein